MKKLFTILNILTATLAARAITATKEYVDRKFSQSLITTEVHKVTKEYRHDVAVENIKLNSGEMFAGLAIAQTNITGAVPVIGITPTLRLYAPYAQGHYTSGLFSAIEIGDYYQMLYSQRMMTGAAAYFPNLSAIRFYGDLTANELDTCKTLQDYFDEFNFENVARLLKGYIPTDGDSAINGSLRVTGTLASEGTIQITNANIIAKKFSVIDGNLTAVGMAITNGFCNLRAANIEHGLSSPIFHITTGEQPSRLDYAYYALKNFTFGGSWRDPVNNLYDYINSKVNATVDHSVVDKVTEMVNSLEGELKSYPIVEPEADKVYAPELYKCHVLNERTFPADKSMTNSVAFLPPRNNPFDLRIVVNYTRDIPTFIFDSEHYWKLVSDRNDILTDFQVDVISVLDFKQIGKNTLAVTRRDMQEVR
jgi:hypothetical protein